MSFVKLKDQKFTRGRCMYGEGWTSVSTTTVPFSPSITTLSGPHIIYFLPSLRHVGALDILQSRTIPRDTRPDSKVRLGCIQNNRVPNQVRRKDEVGNGRRTVDKQRVDAVHDSGCVELRVKNCRIRSLAAFLSYAHGHIKLMSLSLWMPIVFVLYPLFPR